MCDTVIVLEEALADLRTGIQELVDDLRATNPKHGGAVEALIDRLEDLL